MASPDLICNNSPRVDDLSSDYGSDFSLEEELLVDELLSSVQYRNGALPDLEDNPIVTGIEHHASQRLLRLPRLMGRAQRASEGHVSVEDLAAVSVKDVVNTSIEMEHPLSPTCEDTYLVLQLPTNLTDFGASSE